MHQTLQSHSSPIFNLRTFKKKFKLLSTVVFNFYVVFFQCCGAGAGGAEIIWGPGAGAEYICLINIFFTLEYVRMKKS